MEQMRRIKRFGIWLILLTAALRLFETGLPQRWGGLLCEKYAERKTGQDARSFSVGSFVPAFAESPPLRAELHPALPVFTEADAENVSLVNSCGKEPDIAALMARPLELCLSDGTPRVLILHTHTTESYTGGNYHASAAYRTLDECFNMLSIGDRLAELLEAEGIAVIHDRELHDYPSYTGAYSHARKSLQTLLKENPGICLILDLHRDASDGASQLRTRSNIGGSTGSQLMTVLGAGNTGLENPGWQKNLSFALKLQVVLEEQCPGICRPICLRGQRFNQDLGPVTLLIEVGAAGDTHEQAMLAVGELAKAILVLQNGSA